VGYGIPGEVRFIGRRLESTSIISKEVEKAGMYLVQLDTIQDITVVDQCSIIIRYYQGCY